MCSKIRCDGESEKICKIFGKLNRAQEGINTEVTLRMVLFGFTTESPGLAQHQEGILTPLNENTLMTE
jgi:hypothetical protein